MKQSAETTKLRIVYDTSVKPTKASTSLNECLKVGPALQSTLWNVLTRCRLKPVATTGDLKQAFLQIRINEDDRGALRFHWIKDCEILETVALRFTRLMFGFSLSLFVLGAIKHHLERYEQDQPQTVTGLKQNMHVDNMIGGGDNVESAKTFKENIVKIFDGAGFKLHKWQSHLAQLEEEEDTSQMETYETYAKQQLSKGDTNATNLGIS